MISILEKNGKNLLLLLWCLYHGVSGVDIEEVFVKEGDSVTLHTGVKTKHQDRIKWCFNDTLIVEISQNHSKICTDIQSYGIERFRDRLKLDHQTGSLTITNIRNTDSGEYQLKISSSSSDSEKIFSVSVHDSCLSPAAAAGISVIVVLVVEAVAGVICYICWRSIQARQKGTRKPHIYHQDNSGEGLSRILKENLLIEAAEGMPHTETETPSTEAAKGTPHIETETPLTEAAEGTPHTETETPSTEAAEGMPHIETKTPSTEAAKGTPHIETETPSTEAAEGMPHIETKTLSTEAAKGTPHIETETPSTEAAEGMPHIETETLSTEAAKGKPHIETETPSTEAAEGTPHIEKETEHDQDNKPMTKQN